MVAGPGPQILQPDPAQPWAPVLAPEPKQHFSRGRHRGFFVGQAREG